MVNNPRSRRETLATREITRLNDEEKGDSTDILISKFLLRQAFSRSRRNVSASAPTQAENLASQMHFR